MFKIKRLLLICLALCMFMPPATFHAADTFELADIYNHVFFKGVLKGGNASDDYCWVTANQRYMMLRFDTSVRTAQNVKKAEIVINLSTGNGWTYDSGLEYSAFAGSISNEWGYDTTYGTTLEVPGFIIEPNVGSGVSVNQAASCEIRIDITDDFKERMDQENGLVSYYVHTEGPVFLVLGSRNVVKLSVEYSGDKEGNYTSTIESGRTDVSKDSVWTIDFGAQLQTSTIIKNNFRLTKDGQLEDFDITFDSSMSKVTILPSGGFQYGSQYTLQISPYLMYANDESRHDFADITFIIKKKDFEINDLKLYNEDGQEIFTLEGYTGKVDTVLTVTNNGMTTPQSFIGTILLITEQDGCDKMLDIAGAPAILAMGETYTLNKSFDVTAQSKYRIDFHLWNSFLKRQSIYSKSIY